MQQTSTYPRVSLVVGLAIVGGIIGTIGAAALMLSRQGSLLGGPDYAEFILENARVWAASALGGGIGWFTGTVVGWRRGNAVSPPSAPTSWFLRVLALGFIVAAIAIARVVPGGFDSSGIDMNLAYDGAPLQALLILDAALAAGTLLAVSRRTSAQPRIVVACAVTGITVLIAASLVFRSLPPAELSWLQRWLSTRQAPLGAAPNLITPAPVDCPGRIPDMAANYDRSFATDIPIGFYWINPFAPRWLPEGFGLALDRSWPGPYGHGVWTDGTCREVMFAVLRSAASREGRRPTGEGVGWSLVPADWCEDRSSGCIEYQALGTVRGSHQRNVLVLRTVGLDPGEARRIALSIPIRDVAYI